MTHFFATITFNTYEFHHRVQLACRIMHTSHLKMFRTTSAYAGNSVDSVQRQKQPFPVLHAIAINTRLGSVIHGSTKQRQIT